MTMPALKEIEKRIILLRGQRVILDADLAALYGINTKRLNEKLKRNEKIFEEGDIIRLTKKEKEYVVANCDHLRNLRYSPHLPLAFSAQGTRRLSEIVKGPKALEVTMKLNAFFNSLQQTDSQTDSQKGPTALISDREKDILGLIRNGRNIKEIAMINAISSNTVKFHLKNIKQKLGAVNMPHAVGIALNMGFIE